ncbi:MAG: alginate lyase family protein [Candidatus Aminicenantes bacterium]|nr:alginate lyase family protein [Candidatus Aminicenantes bacterium]
MGRLRAQLFGIDLSDAAFLRALDDRFTTAQGFLDHLAAGERPRFFLESSRRHEFVEAIRSVCPDAAPLTIFAADQVCDHVFDLLGSGPTHMGDKIDWHVDFKTGHRFNPRRYYTDVRPASYPGGYDIKVPWELSRCQHFVRLGQAYWILGDEKYALEFVAQVGDWIASNPWPWGVNWACTMDVAIRVVNWLWGYHFFRDSQSLSDKFRLVFYKSMLIHGRHIWRNLENKGSFTNNHYLADLVGLIYLGILCPEFKEAAEWREFGLRELWREMPKQVYSDGVTFEASVAYHRLTTELFLSPILLCRLNSIPVPAEEMARLGKMLEFIMYYTKPDGTVPLLGDADNGCLCRLAAWAVPEREWLDHRYLLAIGGVLLCRNDFAQAAGDQWQEAVWLLGQEAKDFREEIEREGLLPLQLGSRDFVDSGFYVIRDNGLYAIVDAGWNGQGGNGGHAHNDTLSFELYLDGQTWLLDPGTYTYTADYEARHRFRSTAMHNILQVDDEEQNQCVARKPFEMSEDARPVVNRWEISDKSVVLVAEHRGYSRLANPVVHRREFQLNKATKRLSIIDYIFGTGRHNIKATWVLPREIEALIYPSEVILKNKQGTSLVISWHDHAVVHIEMIDISPSYGSLKKANLLSLTKPMYDCGSPEPWVIAIHVE